MLIAKIIFWASICIIFWAMIGYPLSLFILKKIYRNRDLKKNYKYEPTVSLIVVAHNEEKVIYDKLMNIISLDYPTDKIEFIVSSDNSTDNTNGIVKEFINRHPEFNIKLYEVTERKGKTNAQNEAQKISNNEILVMTDANAILKKDSIRELVSSYTCDSIAYVSGSLVYINEDKNETAESESTYWNLDTKMREIESNIQTITAGNGALYSCRNSMYYDFEPIRSHDSIMPRYYALRGYKALYNPDAIAFEKAGETLEDEFNRKVRMNRGILKNILPDIRIINVFKYKWYSYFYFGHRTCRYLLWMSHLTLLISNAFLLSNKIYIITFIGQIIIYLLAILQHKYNLKSSIMNMIYYYCITLLAQWNGVYNILTGKAKPFWDKAESTR